MDCAEVKELLSPYLDRELTVEEMTAIAEHLEDCRDCAEQSTIFGQLSRVIKHWEGIRASEETRRELVEKVRRVSTRARAKRTLPLALLALLAGALLLGGTAALVVWLLGQREPSGDDRPAAAECVQTAGRVEVVQGGAPVYVRGRRKLYAGQELRCNRGSAAQVEIPAAKDPWLRLVLRGPGRLRFAEGPPTLLEGRLIFRRAATMADGQGYPIAAGRWTVMLPMTHSETVGMIELTPEGGIRVGVLEGSVRLGAGGPEVKAGTEVTMDSGGTLSPPKKIGNPRDFDLLVN